MGTTKLFKSDLSVKQMIEYLISFEKERAHGCLSIYGRARISHERHIPCSHDFCAQGDCRNCNLCKAGKYNRVTILKYCFGDNYSPRGNIIK